jgi:hypothetical protein
MPKPLPRAIGRRVKSRMDAFEDERRRNEVRVLHGRRCLVCGRKTNVVHEHKRRGAGGEVSLTNSFLACDEADGGVCHPLLGTRHIMPICPVEPFDAREPLLFEMTEDVAKLVFERRSLPSHIRLVS